MRRSVKDFVSIVAASLPIHEPVYEFGSLQVGGQEGFADLRHLFPEKNYVGCDIHEGTGVDKVLDLHAIDLPSECVGTVLCIDTLEHVEYPHKALEEIHRILKPGGIVVVSSVSYFPVHDHPHDYWRFTPEAFRSLLKPYVGSFVGYAGSDLLPDPVVGIAFKNETPQMSKFMSEYLLWQRRHTKSIEHIVTIATPPKLLPVIFRLHKKLLRLTGRLML
jgi:SAM-dependent methyltransferase